ncbi:MAG: S8 family serine peptidase [Chthoniobacteraceae bacterium]
MNLSIRHHRLVLSAVLLGAVFMARATQAADPERETRLQNRRAELAQSLPANLGRGLRLLAATYDDLATDTPDETTRAREALGAFTHAQKDSGNRVLVDIYLDGTQTMEEVRKQIRKMDGKITASVDWYRHGLVTAWLPIKKARTLAASYGVSAVNLALRPQTRVGKTTSQGVTVHNTTAVNSSGYLGSGVTIGAISDSYDKAYTVESSYPGFTRASTDVATGDLPGSSNPDGYTTAVNVIADGTSSTGITDEGRGMLQIIHDLAPASKLAFATSGTSDSAMATNIGLLQSSAGCKVICDDIVFYDEPMFSDGVIAQAVDSVSAKGVAYFSAAGNDGSSGYSGTFSGVSSTSGLTYAAAQGITTSSIPTTEKNAIYQFHSFGTDSSGNPIVVQNITTGSDTALLDFQWDDPFDVTNGVTADFDILVFSSSGSYLSSRSSIDSNSSTKEPIEIPSSSLAASTSYKICIVLTNRIASGSRKASHLRYVAFTGDAITGDYITASTPTTFGHCCAGTAAGVAAYDYDVIDSTTSHTYKTMPEDYSSNGPVYIYFDSAGNRLSTGILRRQPLIAGVDGVNTTFFPASSSGVSANDSEGDGYPNFYGTSAATPHAAAIAALLINAATVNNLGTLTPADIRTIMVNSTKKTTDQDPNFSSATAGPVTVTASGDSSNTSASSTSFFTVTYNGTSGQLLTQLQIDLSPVALHFDSSSSTGLPFTVGTTSGSTTPAFNGTPTLGTGASSTNSAGKATVNFSNFYSGDTLSFGVDRDEDLTNAGGNSADEVGGFTTAGGATISVIVNGTTYTGTFYNKLNGVYNYKSGYGLLDAQAAVNYLLGL